MFAGKNRAVMKRPAAHTAHMATGRSLGSTSRIYPPLRQNNTTYPLLVFFLPTVFLGKIMRFSQPPPGPGSLLAVLSHMTRNWLQFRPIVVQFSLPRSPYASNITNIHNYYMDPANTPLRSRVYVILCFFFCFYFFRSHIEVCVFSLYCYYFGEGIVRGLAV